MPYGLTQLTDAAREPVTLADAKQFCVVDESFTADDLLIEGLISAARCEAENYTHRAIYEQQWLLSLDYFPLFWGRSTTKNCRENQYPYSYFFDAITIMVPKPKLVSVDSITYIDQTGTTVTMDPTTYTFDGDSEPGRITPPFGAYWPTTSAYRPGNVKITFTTGTYGDGVYVDTCPKNVKTAISIGAAHLYTRREGDVPFPSAFYRLLDAVKFDTFSFGYY